MGFTNATLGVCVPFLAFQLLRRLTFIYNLDGNVQFLCFLMNIHLFALLTCYPNSWWGLGGGSETFPNAKATLSIYHLTDKVFNIKGHRRKIT